ncbi:MAG: hypothetical protein KIS66_08130 [Fimbriimonadaceae bacterium]|nr:hypothetical protein [Fimbriimonadaceae bacterium]
MLSPLLALCALSGASEPPNADPRAFGAQGDGKNDDFPAIERALASIPDRGTLTFSAGVYRVRQTVRVPQGVSVAMQDGAEIAFDPIEGADAPAIVLGSPSSPTVGVDFTNLSIRRVPSGDWKNKESVGLRAIRLVNCRLTVRRVVGFRTGIEAVGEGGGFAHNEVSPGYLAGNRVGLALIARNPDGYCNENLFVGGRFAGVSDRMRREPRYGIVTAVEGGAKSLNNNRFLAPCFELLGDQTTEAIPMVLSGAGSGFTVIGARTESCGPVFARETGDARDNRYDVSYADVAQRIERGPRSTSVLTNASDNPGVLAATRPVWMATDLAARSHDGSDGMAVEGFSFLVSGAETSVAPKLVRAGQAKIAQGGLLLPAGWAIGRLVDARRTRTFVLDASFAASPSGRAVFVFFDGRGQPLGKSEGGVVGGNVQPWFSPAWQAWTMGSDVTGPAFFELKPEVAFAWIGVACGSNPSALLAFNLYTPESHAPASWDGPDIPR